MGRSKVATDLYLQGTVSAAKKSGASSPAPFRTPARAAAGPSPSPPTPSSWRKMVAGDPKPEVARGAILKTVRVVLDVRDTSKAYLEGSA